ncbi:hypothetical protein Dimus_016107 [Dionaea muscipula]
MTSPAVGENEIEVTEVVGDGVSLVDSSTILVTNEGVKAIVGTKRKRRLKKKVAKAAKSGEETESNSELKKEKLPQVVDIMMQPVIADASAKDQIEKDPFGLLFIQVGSDGAMSELLGHEEKVVELATFETIMGEEVVIHRESKGVVVVDDKQRKDEMEKSDGNEGDVTSSGGDVVRAPSAKKGHKIIFTRARLRSPSNKMLGNYLDVMMDPTTRATTKAMQRMPWKHELACLYKNLAEKYYPEKELKIVKRDFDASIAV